MSELKESGYWSVNIEQEDCYLAEFVPWLGAVLSETGGEGSQVGDDTSRDENISSQVVICVLKVICCRRPSEDRN